MRSRASAEVSKPCMQTCMSACAGMTHLYTIAATLFYLRKEAPAGCSECIIALRSKPPLLKFTRSQVMGQGQQRLSAATSSLAPRVNPLAQGVFDPRRLRDEARAKQKEADALSAELTTVNGAVATKDRALKAASGTIEALTQRALTAEGTPSDSAAFRSNRVIQMSIWICFYLGSGRSQAAALACLFTLGCR